jgi:hypothetical protein
LKNDFETNLKRKPQTPSPSPFLLFRPSRPIFPLSFFQTEASKAVGLSFLAPARKWPTRPSSPSPADPTAAPFFFLFRWTLTGGARPSGLPLPPTAGQPPPSFMAVGRYRPVLSLPHLQTSPLSYSSLPHHHSAVSTLKPSSLLIPHQGRMAIDGHGRREPSPLPGLYKRPQGLAAPPSHTPKLPCHPRPRAPVPPIGAPAAAPLPPLELPRRR